ncbi:hypothetical protein KPH14_007205 [Odynerus spinipes]|uniref:Uncharacterized protein n=1 Tax=Odynerus spinipes TaxID=1348599 RepID=A0AAD9R9T1_9HYME|nr:hypothetical protein KPH14_007205 [Odynerus spinipes]
MWKKNGTFKSDWCTPRKVVNMNSENEPSTEKIEKSKKRRRVKSSLRTECNENVQDLVKGTKYVRRLTQSEIIPKVSQNSHDPSASKKMKKGASLGIVSKRVTELAVPRNSAMLNANSKKLRDPFRVRRSALKAVCSPRTKLLARPKNVENFAD